MIGPEQNIAVYYGPRGIRRNAMGLFLVSDNASYTNGSCTVIDGGWTVF